MQAIELVELLDVDLILQAKLNQIVVTLDILSRTADSAFGESLSPAAALEGLKRCIVRIGCTRLMIWVCHQ